MDRQIVYPGQIPLETDVLLTNKDSYLAIAKLAAGILGTSTLLNGLACTPTSPASLQVNVAAGEIYSLQNIDNTDYSSVLADTIHQILKQGINLDSTSLTLTAPSTAGNSINYLIQIGFSETDGGSTVLPYYNAGNPAQPYAGPSNTGTSNNTIRQNTVNISVKAGTQATTGTQTTPSPDAGFVGAWVITVANGQTQITSGDITRYSNAPFIDETLTQKISQTTADARYTQFTQIQNGFATYAVDTGAANAYVAALSPAITSYSSGLSLQIKIANTNTGSSTLSVNGLAAKNIKNIDGSNLLRDSLLAGMIAEFTYDGTNFILLNPNKPKRTASVYLTSTQTIPLGNVATKVLFDGVSFDSYSFYDSVNHRFVAPAAGKAVLNNRLFFNSSLVATNGEMYVEIWKNGVAYRRLNEIPGVQLNVTCSGSLDDICAANDYYEIFAYNDAANNVLVGGTDALLSGFDFEFIGG